MSQTAPSKPPPAAAPAAASAPMPAPAPAKAAPVSAAAQAKVSVSSERKEAVSINVGKTEDKKKGGVKDANNNDAVVAICPPLEESKESKGVRLTLRKKGEAFKPIPVDELKKLVREEDFVVDFYLSCADGTSRGSAEKMKSLATKAGYSCFMASEAGDKEGSNKDIALNLHRCKAFVILLTKQWLEAPECEFEYMIAQRLNMTSSRPVILPVMCEDLNLKDFPIMSSILANLPKIDLNKTKDPMHGLSYALAMIEFLVSPSLLRLPAWRRQREALAYLSSELMVPAKQYSAEEILPGGDYLGFFSDSRAINSTRHDGSGRILFRMSLKFENADKNNNDKKDKEKKSVEIVGVGEDGVDIFRVEKGTLTQDGAVEILKRYVGKMNYSPLRHSTPYKVLAQDHSAFYRSNDKRVVMTGTVKNFVLSGTYAFEESKTPAGYWVMWPMRVYWKYRL